MDEPVLPLLPDRRPGAGSPPRAPVTTDREHAVHRAAKVRTMLVGLWGDELPPGPDPVAAVLADAVIADDEAGRDAGLVVTGDQLSVQVLTAVLTHTGGPEARLTLLPAGLRDQLEPALRASTPRGLRTGRADGTTGE